MASKKLHDHMGVTTQVPRAHVQELKRFALERTNGHSITAADLIREAITEKLERLRAGENSERVRAGHESALDSFARRGLAAQSAVDGAIATATATKPSRKPAPAKRRGGARR